MEMNNGAGAGALLLAAAGGAVLGFAGAVMLMRRDPQFVDRWMDKIVGGVRDATKAAEEAGGDLAGQWRAAADYARTTMGGAAVAAPVAAARKKKAANRKASRPLAGKAASARRGHEGRSPRRPAQPQ